jgi:putative (di)nucleoside polyphosphate hydrolase
LAAASGGSKAVRALPAASFGFVVSCRTLHPRGELSRPVAGKSISCVWVTEEGPAEVSRSTGYQESSEPKPGYRLCVGIFLIGPGRTVFVGQRRDTREPAWQMPQGGIDPGETPLQAAFRELHEEIGTDRATFIRESGIWRSYDLPAPIAERMWNGRYRGQTQKWVALRFFGRDADIVLDTAHAEFSAWRWASVDEVVDLAISFKRCVYLSVVDEFRHLLV